MTMGEMIQTARKAVGLTQVQLGEKLGVSGAMIGQWENNLRNPKPDTITRIAEALGKPFTSLYLQEKSKEHFTVTRSARIADLVLTESFLHQKDTLNLLLSFSFLNAEGKQEAVRSVEIIAGNPIYQRTPTTEATETPLQAPAGHSQGNSSTKQEKPSEG